MDWKGSRCGSRETSEEALALIQVRHGGDLDLGGNSEAGEKWLEYVYILKMEPTGLTNRLDVGHERKKGLRHNSKNFSHSD